jgi:hypothetical protein
VRKTIPPHSVFALLRPSAYPADMPDDVPPVFDPVEDCPWRTPREILARHGYTPLPPSALDDRVPMVPGEIIPPHEDLPFDRDRFLPLRPMPLESHAGWLPGDDEPAAESEADGEPDPLGLAAVDLEIAAAKEEPSDEAASAPPNPALEAQLHASEPDHWTPPAQQLAAQHIPLLPPAELTEETLTLILWELLHNLALRGFYVRHTDHLSDRDLYAELWTRGLREPAHLPGRTSRGGWFHDLLGSWSDEEMQLWLRHYATDDQRAQHAAEYPKEVLPPKEPPVAMRDWRLPKGPF